MFWKLLKAVVLLENAIVFTYNYGKFYLVMRPPVPIIQYNSTVIYYYNDTIYMKSIKFMYRSFGIYANMHASVCMGACKNSNVLKRVYLHMTNKSTYLR